MFFLNALSWPSSVLHELTPSICTDLPDRLIMRVGGRCRVLRAYSRILEEHIVCVEDDEAVPDEAGAVSYTRSELMRLKGLSPDVLRAIHRAKRSFGGRYLGPAPPH